MIKYILKQQNEKLVFEQKSISQVKIWFINLKIKQIWFLFIKFLLFKYEVDSRKERPLKIYPRSIKRFKKKNH
jgi:hypothetical protein